MTSGSTYSSEAAAADVLVDIRLNEIRRAQDLREIDCRTAADLRVAALEAHLEKIRGLRQKYWPEEAATDE